MKMDETVTLFRPVGPKELELIRVEQATSLFCPATCRTVVAPNLGSRSAGCQPGRASCPFHPEQGVSAAVAGAADYSIADCGVRIASAFAKATADKEDLAAMNENIVGEIEVIAEFKG